MGRRRSRSEIGIGGLNREIRWRAGEKGERPDQIRPRREKEGRLKGREKRCMPKGGERPAL